MAVDQTLIQIRERSFPDLLDLGLVLVRERPWSIAAASLAGALPFALLNAWLLSDPDTDLFASILLIAIEAPWATAPLTVVLGGMMFGDRPTPWRAFRSIATAFPPMVLHQFVIRLILLVTVIFYPVVPAKLAFLNEVILLERAPIFRAVGRSSTLCGRRSGELLGQWMAQLLAGVLFVGCFWLGTGAVVNALTTSELTWDRPGLADVRGVRFQIGVWVAVCFFGIVRYLTYVDQRIRLEGWEVKRRLIAAGRVLSRTGR